MWLCRPTKPTLFCQKEIPTRLDGDLWRRRRDLNPRYPFGVYTISNRARSASYATSPYAVFAASPVIIHHHSGFVKHLFPFLKNLLRDNRQVRHLQK